MAEANEQSALLHQEVVEAKKSGRAKSIVRPRRATATKTGSRIAGKQTKAEQPVRSGKSNDAKSPEEQTAAPSVVADAPNIVAEPTTQTVDAADEPREQKDTKTIEPVEEAPSPESGVSRVLETPPAVEVTKYEPVFGEGLIEVSGKGFGFLRDPKRNYVQSPQDIFVTPEVVRKHALRDGFWIKGEVRRGSRGPQLFRLVLINEEDPEKYRSLPVFEELTSINPTERIRLETVPDRYTTRVMDLMTPIGKGQRGLIVAPPRTGKTTLLQHIADAVVRNHPEIKLIILLVDERPEEVTEIRRTVPKADIMAS